MTEKKEPKKVHDLEDLNDELDSSVNLEELLNEAISDADKAVKGTNTKSAAQDSSGNIASAINDMLGDLGGGREGKDVKEARPTGAPSGLAEIEGEETIDEPVSNREQEYYDRLLRVTANFENYKKRVAKEKDDFMRYALSDFAIQLLPVLDNFERALKQIEARGAEKIAEGVGMIQRQMIDVMQKNGVRSIESVGKPFDPTKHQAVELRESIEFEPDTVMEELQRGYFLRDRLLRPAMVVVARAAEGATAAPAVEAVVEILDESAALDAEIIEDVEPLDE